MKTLHFFRFFTIMVLLSLCSCNSSKNVKATEPKAFNFQEAENELRDIWILEWIENVNCDTISFAGGIPTLELQPRDSIALGTTGCNNLNTKLVVQGNNKLSFRWLATTKMYCLNSAEPAYLDCLTRITHYNREGLKLTLLEGEKPLLRYTKVD